MCLLGPGLSCRKLFMVEGLGPGTALVETVGAWGAKVWDFTLKVQQTASGK